MNTNDVTNPSSNNGSMVGPPQVPLPNQFPVQNSPQMSGMQPPPPPPPNGGPVNQEMIRHFHFQTMANKNQQLRISPLPNGNGNDQIGGLH